MVQSVLQRTRAKFIVLTVFMVLRPTISSAGTVEMIVTECVPGAPLAKCGLKMSVTDAATFTTTNGQVIQILPGTTVTVTGAGIITQQARLRPIVNFANSAFGPETAASVGLGFVKEQSNPTDFSKVDNTPVFRNSISTDGFAFTGETRLGPQFENPSQPVSP
jgi:hypothetical protein